MHYLGINASDAVCLILQLFVCISWSNLATTGTIYALISALSFNLYRITMIWGLYICVLTFYSHILFVTHSICVEFAMAAHL